MLTGCFKRVLSLVLAVIMTLSMVPTSAFATEVEHDHDHETVQLVDECTDPDCPDHGGETTAAPEETEAAATTAAAETEAAETEAETEAATQPEQTEPETTPAQEEPEESALVARLVEEMESLLSDYEITDTMTDQQMVEAIAYASDDLYLATPDRIAAIETEAGSLTGEEYAQLESAEAFQLFCRFYAVWDGMYGTEMLAGVSKTLNSLNITIATNGGANNESLSANGNSVTFSAKGTNGFLGLGASSKTSTITITNNNSEAKKISFSITNSGFSDIKYNNESYTSGGQISTLLEAGGTLKISATTQSGDTQCSLTLSNITVAEDKSTVNVKFSMDGALGSVTAGGKSISNGETVEVDTTNGVQLTATPADGYTFVGWMDENNAVVSMQNPFTYVPVVDSTIQPVFASATSDAWFMTKDKTYLSNDLNEIAKKGGTIVLAADGTLPKGDYTIPSGTTLLIPFDDAYTLYTDEPGNVNGESNGWTKPTAYRTLTMASGAKLEVNGAISLSAKFYAAHSPAQNAGSPTGPVSFINMESGSAITVNSGGKLYAWGYITGSGSVTAKSNSDIYEFFQFMDFRGGSQSSGMKNGVFPLSQYYVQNIEVPLKLEYGCRESAYTGFHMNITGVAAHDVTFISSESGSMFTMGEGSYIIKRYDGATDRLVVDAYGDVSISGISMKIGGIYGSIDSKDYELPINSNISITVHSGTITIDQDIALLPGASITIEDGATCKLASGKNVYIYDRDQWGGYVGSGNSKLLPINYAPSKTKTRTENDLIDAEIYVKAGGVLDASAGAVYTTAGGANIHGESGAKAIIKPGTQSNTYQLIYGGDNSTYPEIPVTPAQLKNSNGSYTATADHDGTYVYTNGVWEYDCPHANKQKEEAQAATCTEEGNKEYWTCADCNKVFSDEACTQVTTVDAQKIPATGHEFTKENTESKYLKSSATCTATAVYYKSCKNCGVSAKGIDENKTFTFGVMESHDYSDTWSYDANGHYHQCANCTAKTDETAHTFDNACDTTCNVCSYTRTVTHDYQLKWDASNHWQECSICKDIKDQAAHSGGTADCTTAAICETCKQSYGTAKGHTPTEVPAVEANCQNGGTIQHWHCGTCGKNFSDEACTNELTKVETEKKPDNHVGALSGWKSNENNHWKVYSCCNTTVQQAAHTYGDVTYSWENYTKCVATHTCTCGYTQTENAKISEKTDNATCTEKGKITYSAYFNGNWAETQTQEVEQAALNHAYGDPTYTWNQNQETKAWTCTATRTCNRTNCDHNETATATATSSVKTAATCEAKGWTTYTANFKEGWAKLQTKVEQDIDAIGHKWDTGTITKEPTCTDKGVKTVTCQNDSSHTYTVDVDKVAHTMTHHAYKAATCTEDGNQEYYSCSSCQKNYQDEDGNTEFTDATVIPATGHNMTETPAKDATCTEAGTEGYFYCGNCQKCFEDKDGERETTVDARKIAATGHEWGEVTYTWTENKLTCTAKRVCQNAGACEKTATGTVTQNTSKDATCKTAGDTTYTATFEASWAETQTETVEGNLAPDQNNHEKPNEFTYVNNNNGTHTKKYACCGATAAKENHSYTNGKCVCEAVRTFTITWVNGDETKQTTVKYGETPASPFESPEKAHDETYHYTFKGWTTTKEGTTAEEITAPNQDTTYYIVFEAQKHTTNEELEDKTKHHDCTICGRENVTKHIYNNPSCTENRECTICGVEDPNSALGHKFDSIETSATKWEKVNGQWQCTITSTCTTEGNCHETRTLTVTATETKVEQNPTCTTAGKATYSATFDLNQMDDWKGTYYTHTETNTQEIPALKHDLKKVDRVEPTCIADGNQEYWICQREGCSAAFTDAEGKNSTTVDAMKLSSDEKYHKWGEPEVTDATCTDAGKEVYTCSICKDTKEEPIKAKSHDFTVSVPKVPATCYSTGVSAHTKCSRCKETSGKSILNKIDHTYGQVTYTWTDGETTTTQNANPTAPAKICTATRTCTVEGCTNAAEGHTQTATAKVDAVYDAPNCTKEGSWKYTATFDDDWAKPETTEEGKDQLTVTIGKLDHSYGYTYAWTVNETGATCKATRHCSECQESDSCDATVDVETKKDATCTTEGKIVYKVTKFDQDWARVDEANNKPEADRTHTLKALDHDWKETGRTDATCTADGSVSYECQRTGCTETKTETLKAQGHDLTYTDKVEATCTKPGSASHAKCKNCDYEETSGSVIPALGHDWKVEFQWSKDKTSCTATATCQRTGCSVTETEKATATVNTKDATCTATGLTTYTATFTKEWVKDEDKTQTTTVEIPMKAHSFTAETANKQYLKSEANCDSPAVYYKSCTGCGLSSKEQTGEVTFTNGSVRDHHMSSVSYTWTESFDGCTATRYCLYGDCNHSETATATGISCDDTTNKPTCTANGKKIYTATFAVEWAGTKDWEVLWSKLGHNYEGSDVTYTWADNGSTCSAEQSCRNEGCTEKRTATANKVNSQVTTEATCTQMGKTTYTATFAEEWAGTSQKEIEDVKAKGHTYGDVSYDWVKDAETGEWSCTASRTCSVCAQDTQGHTETASATISETMKEASTCTEMGWTTYIATFSVSWANPTTQDVQDRALAKHQEDSGKITQSPFYNKEGVRTYYCGVCGEEIRTETIPATGKLNISVLGDSITAFTNYSNGTAANTTNSTLSGGKVWFPMNNKTHDSEGNPISGEGEITEAEHIWIYRAAQELGANILVNNSWSGSAVQFYQYGTEGMWMDRCVQLHDDTGDNAGQEPDIIAVYMGTNDFKWVEGITGQTAVDKDGSVITPNLGTYDAVNFDALIQKNEDGTYTYAEPQTTMEAYAVSFHKMQQRYPNSKIFVLGLLQFKDGKQQPNAFNADIQKMAQKFGAVYVDLWNCGIEKDTKSFQYLMEDWLHPNLKGMIAVSNAFVSALRHNGVVGGNYVDVSFNMDGVTALEGTKRTALVGQKFEASLKLKDETKPLQVKVTMGGVDITEQCYNPNGKDEKRGNVGIVTIENVTGAITIQAVAHNHSYTTVITEPTCTEQGYTTYTCSCGDTYKANYTNAKNHSFTTKDSGKQATAATCTENQKNYVQCDRCEEVSKDVTVSVAGTAKGHHYEKGLYEESIAVAATCTEAEKHFRKCDDCAYVDKTTLISVGEANGHSYTIKASNSRKTAATCTEAATYWVQCDNCSAVSTEKYVSVGEANGHSFYKKDSGQMASAATCTEPQKNYVQCDNCDAIDKTQTVDFGRANGHSYTTRASGELATEATCTKPATYYVQCDNCTEVTKNKTVEVGQAKSHSYTTKASNSQRTAATCTEAATYWVQCDNCSAVSTEKFVSVGKANGHSFTNTPSEKQKSAATCTEPAVYYVQCDHCTEISDTEVVKVGKALNHNYGTTSYDWTQDKQTGEWSCTATHICANDASHVETADATITYTVSKQPGCETMGDTTYTARFSVNWATVQTNTVTDVSALDHAYGKTTYVWNQVEGGKWSCTATHVCSRDASHVETETVTATSEVTKDPTCTENGKTTYTATFTKSWAEVQTKTEADIAASGHAYGETIYTWNKTNGKWNCTATRVCANDASHVETETVTATSEVTKDPTCTEDGKTTYTATFTKSWAKVQTKTETDVDKLGHEYGDTAYSWTKSDEGEWTCTATHICANDATHVEKAQATVTSTVVKKASCTEDGTTRYTAKFQESWAKEQNRTETDIAKLGHAYGETTYTWKKSDDQWICTAKHTCGNNASHVETSQATITSKVVKEAACEENGETEYTATFDADWAVQQTKTVADIAKLGHNPVAVEKVLATCTEDGHGEGMQCTRCLQYTVIPPVEKALGHAIVKHEAKIPTLGSVGWDAYEECQRCSYTTYVEIPALEVPTIDSYEAFMESLQYLELIANEYAQQNPGTDPLALIIKYIRTGVDRYNSGSWGIMAGYEDKTFAAYVQQMQDAANVEIGVESEMINVTGLKDIEEFSLPNGDWTDFGHMFGMMDISYHNNFSQNHIDVAGWGGDLVDLLSAADRHNVTGTVDQMAKEIRNNILLHTFSGESDVFSQTDMYGDMDGLYIIDQLKGLDYETGDLCSILSAYFTKDLNDTVRAEYYLNNRLNGESTRNAIREAVYNAYTGNKVVATLEGTRDFLSEDVTDLRRASCYAFADYICQLAGDFVDVKENVYYTDFSTETSTLAPGITQEIHYATSADGKQMVYYIATADINRSDVQVYANYNENDPSLGWKMSRVDDQMKAAQNKYGNPDSDLYIENYNVIAGINASGYNMSNGEPSGLLVMNGVTYKADNGGGFFAITKDGKAIIGETAEDYAAVKDQIQEAVCRFGMTLVKDGKVTVTASGNYYDNRNPRTAVGITKTGKVVFMALDGRQEPRSCGGSMEEIAQIMLEAGCVDAINLDGGGSTTYVSKQEGAEEIAVISNPSDGYTRSVSSSLMMVSTAPSSTAFDHAVVESNYNYMTVGSTVQMTAKGVSATGNTAQLPENAVWVVDGSNGSITESGVLTAGSLGQIKVNLMLGQTVIGSKTINVIEPDNLYFTKSNMNAVYGQTVDLPVKVLYNNKEVAFHAGDLVFTLGNAEAGIIEGLHFTAAEGQLKNVKVTATLASSASTSASITVNLFKQGETTFDFDQATDGDRQLAWLRLVSNSTTEDNSFYEVVDKNQAMVTDYTFAIDMTQIPIPKQLEDLTYMLPGSDIEGASAWTFLLQLAERVSVLTEVTPVFTVDERFDVDISQLKVVNDYFYLTEAKVEGNQVKLTLKWKNQTQAIAPETANPMCILSGLKLTPKADADWGSKDRLEVVNQATISYKIYLRANALYSFACKEENQRIYGLHPFVNNDVIVSGSPESGAWFGDTYKEITDSYTLSKSLKEGWINVDGGFAYYVSGKRLTGIHQIDGLYYSFDEQGVNVGKTTYSGLLTLDGKLCCARNGELRTGWADIGVDYYYFDTETFEAYTGQRKIGNRVYTFNEEGVLVRGCFEKTSGGVRYYWAEQRQIRKWIILDEGTYYANDDGFICYDSYAVTVGTEGETTWYDFDRDTGLLIGICDGIFLHENVKYYAENGKANYGAHKTSGGIVFTSELGMVRVNAECYVSPAWGSTAGLDTGSYWCDENGFILADGFATLKGETYYFQNYKLTKGFTKIGENYYFFNAGSGKMYKNTKLWINGNNPYGISGGYHEFRADGTMVLTEQEKPTEPEKPKNGIVEENGSLCLYIDNVKQTGGLVKYQGSIYFARSNGTLAVNDLFWIGNRKDMLEEAEGYFGFGSDGKLVENGFATNGTDTCYFVNGFRAKGLTRIGEDYYFFNTGNGKMCKDGKYWVSGNNAYGFASGYYEFRADGTMVIPNDKPTEPTDPSTEPTEPSTKPTDPSTEPSTEPTTKPTTEPSTEPSTEPEKPKNGIVDENGSLYLYMDGVKQTNGLVEYQGCIYFARNDGKLAADDLVWVSNRKGMLEEAEGYFGFGSDGKLVENGFATNGTETCYFVNGFRARSLTKVGEKYYFFNAGSGLMYTDTKLWVSGNNAYGFASGYYVFRPDGTMVMPGEEQDVIKNGVVEENGALCLYIDNVKQKDGLVKYQGSIYFAKGNGRLAADDLVWVSNRKGMLEEAEGYFGFGSDGKLVENGFATNGADTCYFINGFRAKGLTRIGDDYYFFNTGSGKMCKDGKYWVSGDNAYGVASGYYEFRADGTMIYDDPEGNTRIEEENGKLYLLVDGVRQGKGVYTYKQEYYFVTDDGSLARDGVFWVTNRNGLIQETDGYFAFDADGKLIRTGFVTGSDGNTYYYKDLVRARGVTKVGEKYYYFDTVTGKQYFSASIWASSDAYNGVDEESQEDPAKPTEATAEIEQEQKSTGAGSNVTPESESEDGFVTDGNAIYYLENGQIANGLTKVQDSYYYFNICSGRMYSGMTLWVNGNNPYGVAGGYYQFSNNGEMIPG